MKQPPTIEPAPRQGPAFDPMDLIVEDVQFIQSFLSRINDDPKNLKYFKSHFTQVLSLRKSILSQIELLNLEPYNYPHSRLTLLKGETEKIFSEIEGIAGAIDPWHQDHFKKFMKAAEKAISQFDDQLTP